MPVDFIEAIGVGRDHQGTASLDYQHWTVVGVMMPFVIGMYLLLVK